MTNVTQRLTGKVCVIVGAASELAIAVAERLNAEGGQVVGIDLQPHQVGAHPIVADMPDEGEAKAAYAEIWDAFGQIDVIYNNVGLVDTTDTSALETSVETMNRIFAANFTTTCLSCKHGIPLMLAGKGGSVINTSSFLAGMGAASAQMGYNAAKAAVAQLSRDLGTNLARRGVRVNALSLGPIETTPLNELFDRLGEAERARRFIHMPLGHFGKREKLAATVAFLASSDSGFITASVIPLNGGIPNAFTVPE